LRSIYKEGDIIIAEKTPFWEDLLIILSIFTLWPTILHKENSFTKILMIIAFVIVFWILIRRIKRIKKITENVKK